MPVLRLIFTGLSVLPCCCAPAPARPKKQPAPLLAAWRRLSSARPPQTLRVSVRDPAAFAAWAARALPGVGLRTETQQGGIVQLHNVTPADLTQLLASPQVIFIDQPDRLAHDERLLNQADLTVNAVTAVHRRYPCWTGAA
jgi:hypothetical protein